MDIVMLHFVRHVPKTELRFLRLQPGERLSAAFDCEDQVPVVALYREETNSIKKGENMYSNRVSWLVMLFVICCMIFISALYNEVRAEPYLIASVGQGHTDRTTNTSLAIVRVARNLS